MGGVAADGAQLGVAALEDFVAERGTHVGAAVEEGAGELEEMETRGGGTGKRSPSPRGTRGGGVFHLVDEGPERGEDLFERSLRLRDLQEAQMHLENLLHQGVVTEVRVQLGLRTQENERVTKNSGRGGSGVGGHNRHLESHDEDAERVQHRQTDLRGHVGLQQTLAAHVCL